MVEHILIPADGPPAAWCAVDYTCDQFGDTKLTLLYE